MKNPVSRAASIALIAVSLPLISACAGADKPQTFADTVRAEGGQAIAVANAWDAGRKLEADGQALTAEGEKLLHDGQADVRKGERLANEGRAEATAQHAAYENAARSVGLAATPDDLAKEIRSLQAIQKAWNQGEGRAARGLAMIADGERAIGKGKSKIREGEALAEKGRSQMHLAERTYRDSATGQIPAAQ